MQLKTLLNSFSLVVRENKPMALGVLALAALSLYLILPSQADAEKLERLFDQGNYQAVRAGAEQVLARDPDAHRSRELLALAELATKRPVEALGHTFILAGAGWDVDLLVQHLDRALLTEQADEEECNRALDLIEEKMPGVSDSAWPKQLGLKLLIKGQVPERIPGFLASFQAEDFQHFCYLLEEVLKSAVASEDWESAWRTAEILDQSPLDFGVWGLYMTQAEVKWQQYWAFLTVSNNASNQLMWEVEHFELRNTEFALRMQLLTGVFNGDQQKMAALQASIPEDALLAVGRGLAMSPEAGLAWLAGWEKENSIKAEEAHVYSRMKGRLIAQATWVEEQHLSNLLSLDVLGAALDDTVNQEKLRFILDYLQDRQEYTAQVQTAQVALAVPKPARIIVPSSSAIWTLNGNWLRAWSWDEGTGYGGISLFQNLMTGAEFELPGVNHSWSPDGSLVAYVYEPGGEASQIRIHNVRGELVGEFVRDGVSSLSWKDRDRLVFLSWEEGENEWFLHELDITGRTREKVNSFPGLRNSNSCLLGPGGRLAWAMANSLQVFTGARIISVDHQADSARVLSWTPDGSGLLLVLDNQLYFYEISGNLRSLDPFGPFYWAVVSWRGNREFYFQTPIILGHTMLAKYNLNTGRTTLMGIVDPVSVAGKRVLTYGISGEVYIYDIP